MSCEKDRRGACQAAVWGGRRRPLWTGIACLAMVVVVGSLYVNALDNLFTNWDDGMIYNNATIRDLSWKGVARIFKFERANNYQPIRMLSYAVDYKFWKLNPMGYRITNVIFYVLTCLMVFFTLRLLSAHLRADREEGSHFRVGLFGALLFAAHPVHVEAVTWLSARKEVLQGFFFFLAFYLYLKAKDRVAIQKLIFLGLVLLVFLMAVLSKPSAVVLPAILILYEVVVSRRRGIDFVKKHWLFFLLASVASLLFAGVLLKAMFDAGGIKPYYGGTFLSNLFTGFYVFLHNIKLLVFTINYSAAYTIAVPSEALNLKNLLVVAGVFILFGLSLWSLKKTKVIFFSFWFFFLTLLPYLNFIPISTLLADRYLFIASFAYCFLLGIGFDRLFTFRHERYSEGFFGLLSVAVFLFLLGGYSFMTVQQNRIWQNSYTLWSDAVAKYPESNTANAMLGVVYMDLGMNKEAVEYLEKAVQVLPIDYQSRNNLGIVYGKLDQPEKALKEFMTAVMLKPEDDSIKLNLSLFYQGQKEYKKSLEILESLIIKNSNDVRLHFRLGLLYKEMGLYESAISELIRVTALAPHVINPYEELGNIYISRMGDIEKGKYYYQKGIEMAPKAKQIVEDLRWMIQDLECYQ